MSGAEHNGERDRMLASVALLYYGEGLTQGEIATRMGVSRTTIVNHLREGRERGIVEIRIQGNAFAGSDLSRRLRERFDLTDAYVAHGVPAGNAQNAATHVGAMALLDLVRSGNRIGITWGETIKRLADHLPLARTEDVTVCQVIGSMETDRLPTSETCAIQIATRLGATCRTLHAPAALSSADLARSIRSEPAIRAQLARFDDLDLAVYSIGDVSRTTHLVTSGIASEDELRRAKEAGAVGVLSARYIDSRGEPVNDPLDERLIGITIPQLRAVPRRLLVAAGTAREAAVRAALAGGLATHLCVDETLAKDLLGS